MKKSQFKGKYFVILLASTLIIAIIIAFKFINSQSFKSAPIDTEVNKITTQSSDTGVSSIEQDLNSTDFGSLDKELIDIDSELDTSL